MSVAITTNPMAMGNMLQLIKFPVATPQATAPNMCLYYSYSATSATSYIKKPWLAVWLLMIENIASS